MCVCAKLSIFSVTHFVLGQSSEPKTFLQVQVQVSRRAAAGARLEDFGSSVSELQKVGAPSGAGPQRLLRPRARRQH